MSPNSEATETAWAPPPPRPSRGVIMISSVSTNDVRRFLLCMRVYSTVAVQGTCTFLLCLGLVLAFPHLKGTVFLCCTGFMPPLSLMVPTICLALLHGKRDEGSFTSPPSPGLLTIYSVLTTLSVIVASACSSSTLVTFSGLLACVLFSLCSCVTGLAGHNHRRWQVIVTLFVIGVIAFLIALYLQPVPLGHKLFLGYYAMALSFMLVVTVFDTTRLFEIAWSEADLLTLCLYENLVYLYLLILILFTTEDSLDKLIAWMTWLSSRATGATNAASISGCDLLREVQRNLTRTMA
ncbi:membrane protein US17 [Human betaherpesvirus 5]|uniref:Membrane protein US17 n=1 Tax=Human cytomegalovirus TaxID=10359 RepID=C8BL66_HCMV|nr:membrane protein US17 [Human betaherpesvirus 5]AHB19625.1 membrane protein US17 [Human betaherpesvirus 5]AHJ86073.1 membrane protein US17 [Human betaherpesvirus 5]AKI24961.1 membrane protein US17 [Human betaherpesvirus 5]AMJ52681.1 membrane protein US17 [Human betaherpesvirus 5]